MAWSIYRVDADGHEIQLTTVGATSSKERALEKVRMYNDRLQSSDPDSLDRFIARDEKGRELKSAS
ncbi:MAG: hypothetical protein KDK39_04565 [Leptospiraceae bacterium]|nr:hypothetical protein [Leptospiraceae bacterium]